jgi:hypothetical protein
MSAYRLVAKHIDAAVLEAETQSISPEVVARNLVSLEHIPSVRNREGFPCGLKCDSNCWLE